MARTGVRTGVRACRKLVGAAMAAGVLAWVTPAAAVNTCNGLLTIDYVGGPAFVQPGDTVRVRLTLGTGSIQGGTSLTINRVRFDLDCDAGSPLGVPCTDEGLKVGYEGDGTITTTCATVWSSGHAVSGAPNEVVLTPAPAVVIPANSTIPPGFCSLEFDVKVLSGSSDVTPTLIEEVTGYLAGLGDATCDNGLASSGTQSSSIPSCPACDDGDACTTDICNPNTGQCEHDPASDGTSCPDTDGRQCTIAACVAGVCNQTYQSNCGCGDGVLDPGETCEPPNPAINPVTGQAFCRPDCHYCGDGLVNGPETCDDANAVSGCDPNRPTEQLDACQNNCTPPICEDPSKIKFGTPLDKFDVHGRIQPVGGPTIDPTDKLLRILLTNANDYTTVFSQEVAAGSVTGQNGRFVYKNKLAKTMGGIFKAKILQKPDHYRFTLRAYGTMGTVQTHQTTHFFIGATEWTVTGYWEQRGTTGWRLTTDGTFGPP